MPSRNKLPKAYLIFFFLLFTLPLFWFLGIPFYNYLHYQPKPGDILFQPLDRSIDLVRAIEGITRSDYSHCGVVILENGEWKVCEAFGFVRKVPLYQWMKRGRGFRVDVFRIKKEYNQHIESYLENLKPFLGKPYDSRYRMEDDAIYCSELVYKAWLSATGLKMGELKRLGDLNWKPYVKTIKKYERAEPPLDRLMITPIDLSKSDYISQVASYGF